jgi:hypothetical protein
MVGDIIPERWAELSRKGVGDIIPESWAACPGISKKWEKQAREESRRLMIEAKIAVLHETLREQGAVEEE